MAAARGKGLGFVLIAYLGLALTAVGGHAGLVLAANPSMELLRTAAEMVDASGLAEVMDGGAEQLAQLKRIIALTESAARPGAYLSLLTAGALIALLFGCGLAYLRLRDAGVDDLGLPGVLVLASGPLGMGRIEQAARGAALTQGGDWRRGRVLPLATLLAVELPVIGLLALSILRGALDRLPAKGLTDPAADLETYVTQTLLLDGAMMIAAYGIAYGGWQWLWTVHKALRQVPAAP
jgi:hypothetical protein